MKRKRTLLLVTFVSSLCARPSGAGDGFALGDHITLTASDRVRGEFVSWFDPAGPNSNNNYNFFANRLRFGGILRVPNVEFVVEGQYTELLNLPGGNSINSGPGTKGLGPLGPGALYYANTMKRDQGQVFLHLGYATVSEFFGLPGLSVRGGRFGYNNGLEKPANDPTLLWLQRWRISQRLIGNFDYTNVGRSFDGLQTMYDHGPFNLTLLGSHPTAGGYDIRANYAIKKIDLAAATASLVEPSSLPLTSAQLFYMYYADRRDLVATDNRPRNPPPGQTCSTGNNSLLIRSCDLRNITINTIGANAIHLIDLGPGKMDLLGWVAGQVGDWQSLNHTAWAYDIELGYQLPNVILQPWLRYGFYRGSGDRNNADHDHTTFFQILPTARLYALFPFYNMMNNQDMFLQGIVRPLPGLSAAVSGHWLRLTESADLWYAGGGATSYSFFGYSGIPSQGRSELSYLTDIELTYVFNKHFTFYTYYGHAFGQGVVSGNFIGNNADYAYIEATVSL